MGYLVEWLNHKLHFYIWKFLYFYIVILSYNPIWGFIILIIKVILKLIAYVKIWIWKLNLLLLCQMHYTKIKRKNALAHNRCNSLSWSIVNFPCNEKASEKNEGEGDVPYGMKFKMVKDKKKNKKTDTHLLFRLMTCVNLSWKKLIIKHVVNKLTYNRLLD